MPLMLNVKPFGNSLNAMSEVPISDHDTNGEK
ncbi:hypothetical protein BH20GEM2_BH20GEM2_18120 [soil metagenome]